MILPLRRNRGNPQGRKEIQRLNHPARFQLSFLFPRHHPTRRSTNLCLYRFCDWLRGHGVRLHVLRQLTYRWSRTSDNMISHVFTIRFESLNALLTDALHFLYRTVPYYLYSSLTNIHFFSVYSWFLVTTTPFLSFSIANICIDRSYTVHIIIYH